MNDEVPLSLRSVWKNVSATCPTRVYRDDVITN
jgi:hypothetical protein